MNLANNIYDIDGNIIRRAGEGSFTLEETEQLVDNLTKKVEENPDNDVYKVYLRNAQKWLFKLYNEMKPEDLMKRVSFLQNSVDAAKNESIKLEEDRLEEINKTLDRLKEEYENEPVVMDEYVSPIGEDSDEYVEPENIVEDEG